MRRILPGYSGRSIVLGILLFGLADAPTFAFTQEGSGPLCHGVACHQTNPYTTGCANSAILQSHASLFRLEQAPSQTSGMIEEEPDHSGVLLLWQSLACQTYFAVAMSDDFSCQIEASIWHWNGKKLGSSNDPGGSAPSALLGELARYGNLEFAYTPQVFLSPKPKLWAQGKGKLCNGTVYAGDTLQQEEAIV